MALREWKRKGTRLSRTDPKLGSVQLPVVVIDGVQYTVDDRLSEFRKVTWKDGNPSIEFIPFASKLGMDIQYKMDLKNLKRPKK
jgi:hypothetical protein